MRKAVFFLSRRRRHTSYWRDWSSDVCSSDLTLPVRVGPAGGAQVQALLRRRTLPGVPLNQLGLPGTFHRNEARMLHRQNYRGAERKRVVVGKRVDAGGSRIIKKKK